MTHPALIWVGALGVSAVVHVASAYGLYAFTRPGDVPDQAIPETEMQLAAYQVRRSEAQETAPDADQAAAGDTSGSNLAQGAIATSRATTVSPTAAISDPVTPRGNEAKETLPTPAVLQRVEQAGETIAAETVKTATVAPVAPQPQNEVASVALSQTVATGSIPSAQQVAAVAPTGNALAANSVTSVRLSAARETPTGSSAASLQPVAMRPDPTDIETEAAPTMELSGRVVPEQTMDAAALSGTILTGDAASEQALSENVAPEAEPSQVVLDQRPVDTTDTPALSPPADRARASLAFPNAGDGAVDPVSLQAFQSFMEPGDLTGAAAEVRDGIRGALSAIPCSRLQVQFDPENNSLLVSGHVPDPDLRSTVVSAMQSQMGQDIPVREDLLILPRPQCGALTGIADVGLPQSTDQITNPLLVGEDTHAREFRYSAGNPLVMTLQGADYDAYVYVDYFDADGNVLHLMPNEFTPLERTEAEAALQIGSDHVLAPGEPGLYIEIGPPFGQEIAVAFAASEPLYEGVRPLVEPAEPYLDWLRDRVAEARAAHPDFKGEWVYFFISTSAE